MKNHRLNIAADKRETIIPKGKRTMNDIFFKIRRVEVHDHKGKYTNRKKVKNVEKTVQKRENILATLSMLMPNIGVTRRIILCSIV